MKVTLVVSTRVNVEEVPLLAVAFFGILKVGGKVYTKVVSDIKSEALMHRLQRK